MLSGNQHNCDMNYKKKKFIHEIKDFFDFRSNTILPILLHPLEFFFGHYEL